MPKCHVRRALLVCVMVGIVTLLCYHSTAPLYAQTGSCNTTISELQNAIGRCAEINSNWACYGVSTTTALPVGLRFTRPGDRQPITSLDSITTIHPDGAAFMRLFLVGEQDPLTIMLFGGSELDPVAKDVFLLRFESSDPVCANTAPGMVARTESGKRGRITVNGVDIELQSSAFITMRSEKLMTIVNLGGQVTINAPNLGVLLPLPQAQQVEVTQENGVPSAIGQPQPSPFAQSALLQWLTEDPAELSQVVDHNTEPSQAIPACGGTIAIGQTVEGQTAVSGQECLYTFQGTAGDVVTVDAVATAGGMDPWVDLRGPTGDMSGFNNDMEQGEQSSQLCNHGLAEGGQYTIVVRPYHNESAGSFALTLNGETSCLPAPPECEVVSPEVVMRTGPDFNYPPPVQSLTEGARFEPLASLADGHWVQIALLPGGEQGWISVNPYELLCDIALEDLPVVTPPSPPPITPTFTPTPPPLCYKAQPPNWCAYRVQTGDNLTNIAGRTNANLDLLRRVNCKVDSDIIRIDEILYVPCPPTPTPTPTPTVTPVADAHLTLIKQVVNDNGGTAVAGDWTLVASGPTLLSGKSGVEGDVPAGAYTLSEQDGPSGYTASAWSCNSGGQEGAQARFSSGDQVTLSPGESVVCTITNDDQPAHLTLNKQVTNDNGGSAVASDWTLVAYGPTLLSHAGRAERDVAAGTYTLSEQGGPSGYTASAWSCDGGSQDGAQVTLSPGKSVTCIITNDDKPAHLKLVKNVISGAAEPSEWTLKAEGPTPLSGAGGVEDYVDAGTYTLSEQGEHYGYTASDWSCDGGSQNGDQVTLSPGESVTCTITNSGYNYSQP